MTKEVNEPISIISFDTKLIWGYVKYPSYEEVRLMKNREKNGI